MILNRITKIPVLEASPPDSHWTTLSLRPVLTGSHCKYLQFHAALLSYFSIPHMTMFFSFPRGKSATKRWILWHAWKSVLQTWHSISRGHTGKLWSDAGYRTQETRVQSLGLSEGPHKWKEGRTLLAAVKRGSVGYFSCLCQYLGSHLLFPGQ